MAVKTYPDCEGGLRTWLRTQSDITTQVSTRVFFGIPRDSAGVATTIFPVITLQRVGGSPQSGEAPLDDALIQLDCWANGQNKVQAWTVAKAVIDTLESLTPQEIATGVYAYGASVESVIFLPDPTDSRARYVITALVTTRTS